MLAYGIRIDLGDGAPIDLPSGCGCDGFDMTSAAFSCRKPRPQSLYAGDDWQVRIKVYNPLTSAAIDLTGALVAATLKLDELAPVGVLRRSDVSVIGSFPLRPQIILDAQVVDNGDAGLTGRGWFAFTFGHELEDYLALSSVVGLPYYDLRLRLVAVSFGGSVATILFGRIEVLRPRTAPMP